MEWSYVHRLAYGITVNVTQHQELKRVLDEHRDFIGYDFDMSLQGPNTVFIYIKSSYREVFRDTSDYTVRQPSKFWHPCGHISDSRLPAPAMSSEEKGLLYTLRRKYMTAPPEWIRHAYIW